MNLEEWKQKTGSERRRQICEWVNHGNFAIYENLAFEARAELESDLRKHDPEANVQLGPGESLSEDPLQPCVEIVLHAFNCQTVLDSVFCGFQVVAIDVNSRKQQFLDVWRRLFKELKGWNDSQTISWAQRWMDALEGRKPSAITHYGPVEAALPELVGEEIKKREQKEQHRLPIHNEIRAIFSRNGISTYGSRLDLSEMLDKVNWIRVKREYEEAIAKYKR